jgi:hypothetical protein
MVGFNDQQDMEVWYEYGRRSMGMSGGMGRGGIGPECALFNYWHRGEREQRLRLTTNGDEEGPKLVVGAVTRNYICKRREEIKVDMLLLSLVIFCICYTTVLLSEIIIDIITFLFFAIAL